jgi:hypothetical protein
MRFYFVISSLRREIYKLKGAFNFVELLKKIETKMKKTERINSEENFIMKKAAYIQGMIGSLRITFKLSMQIT